MWNVASRLPGQTHHPSTGPCWITFLEVKRKQAIIADNLSASAMYGGAIESRGPRYCPSVEDKVVKFPDAERHQIFLEPEGLDTSELYVNGLSTSLPADCSARRASFDSRTRRTSNDPSWLRDRVRLLPADPARSFVPGEGAVAVCSSPARSTGRPATRRLRGRESLPDSMPASPRSAVHRSILGRHTSYIGVLADDLVTRGVDEPYRLFTSRSEFRLTVRQDNALRRLAPIGLELGLYTEAEESLIADRFAAEDSSNGDRPVHERSTRCGCAAVGCRAEVRPLPHAMRIAEVVKRQGVVAARSVRRSWRRAVLRR